VRQGNYLSTGVIFESSNRCRHSVFTDYFGDEIPSCVDKCDCCVDAKAVQKKIDQFHIMSARTSTSMRMSKAGDDLDLYGGGRAGQQRYKFARKSILANKNFRGALAILNICLRALFFKGRRDFDSGHTIVNYIFFLQGI
jgi:hypothetical protein